MKEELTDQQNEAILKALNEAIEKGPWNQSNFLRVIGKNLNEIRDNFLNQLGASKIDPEKIESNLANRIALRSGQQEVFISLYSADGGNLQTWERIVFNLPGQVISRPIYIKEEDIKTLLKSKENKANEAYVAIYINKADILPLASDKVVFDKFGTALLSLKDKSINVDNISRFVHMSGIYKFEKGRLIKTS